MIADLTLHSTMFLLIHIQILLKIAIMATLHSTMFLLILEKNEIKLPKLKLYIPQCFY